MRYVDLPFPNGGAPARVSILGFGCGALLGRVGRKDSLRALAQACDAGINYFDTARSYGYGESEALLGEFLQGRRDKVVICTKFGILPAARGGWKQRIKPLAQAVVRAVPALRSIARKGAAGAFVPGQFTPAILRLSLETSLRALRTDYVDQLLMHAAPAATLHQHDLLELLQKFVDEGKIRSAGISAELDVIEQTFAHRPPVLSAAQFAVNCNTLAFTHQTVTPQAQDMFLVANHPFGGPAGVAATTARIADLANDPTLPDTLRAKCAGKDPQLMPEVVLNTILNDTGIAAVVPAMMRPASLRSNIAALDNCRFTDGEVALLREALIRRP